MFYLFSASSSQFIASLGFSVFKRPKPKSMSKFREYVTLLSICLTLLLIKLFPFLVNSCSYNVLQLYTYV